MCIRVILLRAPQPMSMMSELQKLPHVISHAWHVKRSQHVRPRGAVHLQPQHTKHVLCIAKWHLWISIIGWWKFVQRKFIYMVRLRGSQILDARHCTMHIRLVKQIQRDDVKHTGRHIAHEKDFTAADILRVELHANRIN